jgi:hypothetical protein
MTDADALKTANDLVDALNYVIRDLEIRADLKPGTRKGVVDIGNGAYVQAVAARDRAPLLIEYLTHKLVPATANDSRTQSRPSEEEIALAWDRHTPEWPKAIALAEYKKIAQEVLDLLRQSTPNVTETLRTNLDDLNVYGTTTGRSSSKEESKGNAPKRGHASHEGA